MNDEKLVLGILKDIGRIFYKKSTTAVIAVLKARGWKQQMNSSFRSAMSVRGFGTKRQKQSIKEIESKSYTWTISIDRRYNSSTAII